MLPYHNQYMPELVKVKPPNINIIPLEKKKIKIIQIFTVTENPYNNNSNFLTHAIISQSVHTEASKSQTTQYNNPTLNSILQDIKVPPNVIDKKKTKPIK